MLAENFKLILITPEKNIAGEAVIINKLFETGLQLLHIRKPSYTLEETKTLIKSIATVYHSKIVLHSYYELLNEFNLKGAHLPEKERKKGNANQIKNIISTSFHSLTDLTQEKINFEYAFLSPLFQSISKPGYTPSLETKKIQDFFNSEENKTSYSIIALGGITDKNILKVQDMGFGGAAFIGYVWESPNPVERFKRLQKISG